MNRATAILSKALTDLKTRCKVDLNALLPEEIGDIVRACDRVAEPFKEVNADAAGFPVRVCDGVWFWRLTIGAAIWMGDFVEKWWGDDYVKYRAATIYACMNARNAGAFRLDDRRKAESAIRKALRGIAATQEEIDLALDKVISRRDDADPGDVPATAANWAAMIARVEAQTGLPREHWLWGVSYSSTLAVYNQCERIVTARSGKDAAAMQDELDLAHNALQRLKVRIMGRING